MALFVASSAFGAVNGCVYGNARIIAAAAGEGVFLPKSVSRLSSRGTPLNGILLSSLIHILLLIPDGGFTLLAPLYSFISWFWYASTVAALIWLRKKRPNMKRPFQIPLPIAITFCLVCVPILAFQFYDKDPVVRFFLHFFSQFPLVQSTRSFSLSHNFYFLSHFIFSHFFSFFFYSLSLFRNSGRLPFLSLFVLHSCLFLLGSFTTFVLFARREDF